MIELTRIYVGSGLICQFLINPRYIKKIEQLSTDHKYFGVAKSVIYMDDGQEGVSIIYVENSYTSIRTKILGGTTKRKR